jgi:acetoin utilization protein AcuB
MSNEQFRLLDLIDQMCDGKIDVFFRALRTVKDLMTRNVKTLTLDDTVGTCLRIMDECKIRHVPVVDPTTGKKGQPYFVGIVSQRDVFRQVSLYVGKVGEEEADEKAVQQRLGKIVTRNPQFVSPETSIKDLITVMVNDHIDSLPVVVDKNLVGIVTTSDVLKFFVRFDAIMHLCPEKTNTEQKSRFVELMSGNSDHTTVALSSVLRTVEDVMTEHVVCLERQHTLATVMETMQKGKFRHVPVVDRQKKLVGIISDRDVLHYLPIREGQRRPQPEVFRGGLFDVIPNEPALHESIDRIMKRNIIHVAPNCSFYDAVKMLYEKRISCLPVVDGEKTLLGLVTVTDVMRALLAAYALFEKNAV